MLENICVVLVRTFHSGNIGSAARAMKTMGLSDLVLVEPRDFATQEGKDEAFKMAMSANDLVDNITQADNLYDAVKDCSIVVASTARERAYDLPYLDPEESAKKLLIHSTKGKVALVFGPERMGLSNEDLEYCKYRVTIPTNPDYSSLNIAAAVQTLTYEIYKNSTKQTPQESISEKERTPPDMESLERLFVHMEETLGNTGFIIKNHPGEAMKKLRKLLTRSELDEEEVKILRGVFSSVDRLL